MSSEIKPETKIKAKPSSSLPITEGLIIIWFKTKDGLSSYRSWLNDNSGDKLYRLADTLTQIYDNWASWSQHYVQKRLQDFLYQTMIIYNENIRALSESISAEETEEVNESTDIFAEKLGNILKTASKLHNNYPLQDWLAALLRKSLTLRCSLAISLMQGLATPLELASAINQLGQLAKTQQLTIGTQDKLSWLINLVSKKLAEFTPVDATHCIHGLSLLMVRYNSPHRLNNGAKPTAIRATLVNNLLQRALKHPTSAQQIIKEIIPSLLILINSTAIDDLNQLSIKLLDSCVEKIFTSSEKANPLAEALHNIADIIYWINQVIHPVRIKITTLTICLKRAADLEDISSKVQILLSTAQIIRAGEHPPAEKKQLRQHILTLVDQLNGAAEHMQLRDLAHTLYALQLLDELLPGHTEKLVAAFEKQFISSEKQADAKKPEQKTSYDIAYLQQGAQYIYAIDPAPKENAPDWMRIPLAQRVSTPAAESYHGQVMALLPSSLNAQFGEGRFHCEAEKLLGVWPGDIYIIDKETGKKYNFELDEQRHFRANDTLRFNDQLRDALFKRLVDAQGKNVVNDVIRIRIRPGMKPKDVVARVVKYLVAPAKEAKVATIPVAASVDKPSAPIAAAAAAAPPAAARLPESKVEAELPELAALVSAMPHSDRVISPKASEPKSKQKASLEQLSIAIAAKNEAQAKTILIQLLTGVDNSKKASYLIELLEICKKSADNVLNEPKSLFFILLPQFGRDILTQFDPERNSPLIWAVKNDYPVVVEAFIEKAKPNPGSGKKDKKRKNPVPHPQWDTPWQDVLVIAKKSKYKRIADLLEKAGVPFSAHAPDALREEQSHFGLEEKIAGDESRNESSSSQLEKFANAGMPQAQIVVALQCIDVVNQEISDVEKFRSLSESLADAGEKWGYYFLGFLYSDHPKNSPKKDEKKSFDYFLQAAQDPGGLKAAQFEVGVCYSEGKGAPEKDEKEALKWMYQAAQDPDGRKEAQYYIATSAAQVGEHKKAFRWFQKAAQEPGGYDRAQLFTGIYYLPLGKGTKVDYPKALYWLNLAAKSPKTKGEVQKLINSSGLKEILTPFIYEMAEIPHKKQEIAELLTLFFPLASSAIEGSSVDKSSVELKKTVSALVAARRDSPIHSGLQELDAASKPRSKNPEDAASFAEGVDPETDDEFSPSR